MVSVEDVAAEDFYVHPNKAKSFAPLFPKMPSITDEAIRATISVTDHPTKAAPANPKHFYDIGFFQSLSAAAL